MSDKPSIAGDVMDAAERDGTLADFDPLSVEQLREYLRAYERSHQRPTPGEALARVERKADLALAQVKALTAGLRLLDEAITSPGSGARGNLELLFRKLEQEDPDGR